MSAEPSTNRRNFLVSAAAGTVAGVASVAVQATCPTQAQENASRQYFSDFLTLSCELTGVSKLDDNLGRQYLSRFCETFGSKILTDLLREYCTILTRCRSVRDRLKMIKHSIMDDEYRGAAAEQIIYLWYLSAFYVPNPLDSENREEKEEQSPTEGGADPDDAPKSGVWQYGTLEQYEKTLIWPIIGAHAPMTPGGPMGHWKDKPKRWLAPDNGSI